MFELVTLHGSDGVAGLVLLHRRMSALGAAPVGEPETVWRVIRERMPDVVGHRRKVPLRRRLTRPLAIVAAAVLIAGSAYAGSPDAVHRYLTSFWHAVQSILDVDVSGNVPAEADRPSQGGGQADGPAGVVHDAELEDQDGDEANEGGDQLGETSVGNGGANDDEAEGDDENGSGGDGDEGSGGDEEGNEPDGDEGDEPDDDEGDEPESEGDEPDDDGGDPESEDDPDGSGGGEDDSD